jgi:diguanylate cyclase (GGDEF)-like protein
MDRVVVIDGAGAIRYASPALRALVSELGDSEDRLGVLRAEVESAIRLGRTEGEVSALSDVSRMRRWQFRLVPLDAEGSGEAVVLAMIDPAGEERRSGAAAASSGASEQRTRELAQANRELQALNDVALAVNQTLELSAVLGIALEKALGAAQIETGWVRLLSENGSGDLEMVAQRGLGRACAEAVAKVPLHDSFAGKAVLTGKPIVLYSLPMDSNACRALATYEGIRCLANIPLRSKHSVIGVLAIGSRRILQISERLVHFLTAIGSQVGMAIENARLYEQVQRRSWLDPLTQLYNRQRFHELLEEELRRRPADAPPPVILADLNQFKELNDTLGHTFGDQALCRVAQHLREVVAPGDIVGRFGGDEFVIALMNDRYTAYRDALSTLLHLLRKPIEADCIDPPMRLSLSIGLSTEGSTVEELLQRADQAMYVEKRRHHAR